MRVFFRCGVVAGAGLALLGSGVAAQAQARASADRRLDLSAFGLFSGTYTGLGPLSYPYLIDGPQGPEGRNLTFSLGADLGVYTFHGARLGAEVRGSTPIKSGQVDSQKSILAGIRVTHEPSGYGFLGHVRPYVDVLAGRGQMKYQGGGYLVQDGSFLTEYLANNSAVYDAGGGFELDVTRRCSIKVDAQFQRWNTLVNTSGVIYSKQGGVGIVYRYGTGRGPR
ncbi:MAG: hypothetical protein ACRYGF_06780 [Janthinobacterium lividum]